jgi:hypothetical protein
VVERPPGFAVLFADLDDGEPAEVAVEPAVGAGGSPGEDIACLAS